MGNILKNTVECTCEEFVAEIAGKRRKPYLDALKSTFKTIVLGKSRSVFEGPGNISRPVFSGVS